MEVGLLEEASFWLGMWNVGAGMGAGSVLLGTGSSLCWESLSIAGCIVSRLDSDSEELELKVVKVRSSGVALGAITGLALLTTVWIIVVSFFSAPFLAASFFVQVLVSPAGPFTRHDSVLGRIGGWILHLAPPSFSLCSSAGRGTFVVGLSGGGFWNTWSSTTVSTTHNSEEDMSLGHTGGTRIK